MSLFPDQEETGNFCVRCGVDMGAQNDRQLCCKTYCSGTTFNIDRNFNDSFWMDEAGEPQPFNASVLRDGIMPHIVIQKDSPVDRGGILIPLRNILMDASATDRILSSYDGNEPRLVRPSLGQTIAAKKTSLSFQDELNDILMIQEDLSEPQGK